MEELRGTWIVKIRCISPFIGRLVNYRKSGAGEYFLS